MKIPRQVNPVLRRGIQTRMRGVRAPILMSVYFIILLAIYTLVYAGNFAYSGYRPYSEGSEVLVVLFSLLICMVFIVIIMMVPAMNAGNIASEREKQTLDLLLCSRMSALRIVMGKLLSNLTFILFLLVLTLPLFAVTYLFGNILIRDILLVFFFMAVSAYGCASVATFFSALVKKTSVATILSYIAIILFGAGTGIVGGLDYAHYMMRTTTYDTYVPFGWLINPVFAIVELLARAGSSSGYSTFMDMMEEMPAPFILISSIFIVVVSITLNIFSAVLIKPVQKFQRQK